MSARGERIMQTMHTPGWLDIEAMLNEQASGPESELCEIMAKRPDTLTGKTALKYAIKARALRDFMESLKDEVRLTNQPQPIRAG